MPDELHAPLRGEVFQAHQTRHHPGRFGVPIPHLPTQNERDGIFNEQLGHSCSASAFHLSPEEDRTGTVTDSNLGGVAAGLSQCIGVDIDECESSFEVNFHSLVDGWGCVVGPRKRNPS